MLVAAALIMAAVHDFENVVTAVSDVSCNIVQLRYAVFFFWGGDRCRGRTIPIYVICCMQKIFANQFRLGSSIQFSGL